MIGKEVKEFRSNIKDVKLNFKIGALTPNDHIYKRNNLESKFREALITKLFIPVTRNYNELVDERTHRPIKPKLENVIGRLVDFRITDGGEVILKIKPTIDTELFDNFLATTMVDGKLIDGNIVEIESLIGFYLTPNKDKVLEREKN